MLFRSHEDVSISNYVYSYVGNTAYHKLEDQREGVGGDVVVDVNRSIDIVGVNMSRLLVLPNTKADWFKYSVKKNPEELTDGHILWGHSIRRGNHTQYLYWKTDKKFKFFWEKFYKLFTGFAARVSPRGSPAEQQAAKRRFAKQLFAQYTKDNTELTGEKYIRDDALSRMKQLGPAKFQSFEKLHKRWRER